MTTHENLLATAEALKSAREEAWQPRPYPNKNRVWGVSFRFWSGGHYHFISVHNCDRYPSFLELAHAVEGIETLDDERWGIYENSKRVPGFYATAKSTRTFDQIRNRWYMISRSDQRNFIELLHRRCAESEYDHELEDYLNRDTNGRMKSDIELRGISTPRSSEIVIKPNIKFSL